jgi:hypothetical protein
MGGDGEVLHQAGQVAEAEVDDFDPLIPNQPKDVARGALLHATNLHLKGPDLGSAA